MIQLLHRFLKFIETSLHLFCSLVIIAFRHIERSGDKLKIIFRQQESFYVQKINKNEKQTESLIIKCFLFNWWEIGIARNTED